MKVSVEERHPEIEKEIEIVIRSDGAIGLRDAECRLLGRGVRATRDELFASLHRRFAEIGSHGL